MKPRSKKVWGRSLGNGVRVYKDAAPKAGTKLTPDRIAGHFRSLNSDRRSGRS